MPRRRAVTIDELARRLALSPATVSKALSGEAGLYRISLATCTRVQRLANELGYRPRHPTDATAQRRRPRIGLPFFDKFPPSNTCYVDLPGDLTAALSSRTMDLMPVLLSDGWRQWQAEGWESFLDGVVLINSLYGVLDEFDAHSRLPGVIFNLAADLRFDQVVVDHRQGATQVAEHLLGLGHRHLLYVNVQANANSESMVSRERTLGAAFAQAGGRMVQAVGVADALARLDREPAITAVATYDEQSIPDLVAACHEQGRRLPTDLSLVSCGSAPPLAWVWPAVTALEGPWHELAAIAAQLVAARIDGHAGEPQRLWFNEQLVVRTSTGPAPRRCISRSGG